MAELKAMVAADGVVSHNRGILWEEEIMQAA